MDKAVLVLNEMPKSCFDCPVVDITGISCTGRLHEPIEDILSKPTWCPLRSMPEKKTETYRSEFARGIKKGWNDAIKAIDPEGYKLEE